MDEAGQAGVDTLVQAEDDLAIVTGHGGHVVSSIAQQTVEQLLQQDGLLENTG